MALFKDGNKLVDFVLVYRLSQLSTMSHIKKLTTYLENIIKAGLHLEVYNFSGDPDVCFILLHASLPLVEHYANVYDIEFSCRVISYRPPFEKPLKWMSNPLTSPDPNSAEYKRSPSSFSGFPPTKITNCEKILIVGRLLRSTPFGYEHGEFGFNKMVRAGILNSAFPMHDGHYEWTTSGPLNDRQILSKYWANPKCWYHAQPLNLIERYYGTELCFYFAWVGFYLYMLIPVASVGVLCILYGLATMFTPLNGLSPEICNSDIILCPRCVYGKCKFEYMKNSCIFSYFTYLFENPASIFYSVVISIWSTFFVELWGRQEAFLQIRWNVQNLEHDITQRPEYEESKTKMISPITGELVPYTPVSQIVYRYTLTIIAIFVLLLVLIGATVGVMIYRVSISIMLIKSHNDNIIKQNVTFIASISGSIISTLFIFLFKPLYSKLALRLTNWENHRTQSEFDNAYVYKTFALAFINNYAALFYIAFFKGRLYKHPGDMSLFKRSEILGSLESDICDPTGCIFDLSLQLATIIMSKTIFLSLLQIITPKLANFWRSRSATTTTKNDASYLGPVEQNYLLSPLEEYYLVDEYMELIIQYGFVTFFSAAFPISGVLALISSMMELRLDATKMITDYRRPVPKLVDGIGAWKGILEGMTYFGIITNALIIAFTGDTVPKMTYKYNVDDTLKGYVKWTVSEFKVTDLQGVAVEKAGNGTCYYVGQKLPPESTEDHYNFSTDHWFILASRFATVLIFEHVVFILAGIIAYAIPNVPFVVKENIKFTEKAIKNKKMEILEEQFRKMRLEAEQREQQESDEKAK